MTEREDPPRWADDAADASPGSLLRAARDDGATDRELEQLASKLGPVLAPGPPPFTVPGTLLTKLGAGVALAAVIAAGVHYAHSRVAKPGAASASESTPHAGAAALPSAASPAAVLPNAEQPPTGVEPTGPASPASSESAAQGGAHPVPTLVREGGAALDEAALLERARAALSTSPARALALAGQHAKLFPHGLLGQEREVIAIAALRRLGRTAEAERRAEAFDRSYPNSAHQRSVDAQPVK